MTPKYHGLQQQSSISFFYHMFLVGWLSPCFMSSPKADGAATRGDIYDLMEKGEETE